MPHAGLERDAQVPIVLHVRLVENQVRVTGRAFRARMRVVPVRAFRVHHLLDVGRVAGVIDLAVHRIDFGERLPRLTHLGPVHVPLRKQML